MHEATLSSLLSRNPAVAFVSKMTSFLRPKRRTSSEGDAGNPENCSRSSEEKDEKIAERVDDTTEVASIDAKDVDEALLLVGTERGQEFSEEYNAKLRRKLVRYCQIDNCVSHCSTRTAKGFCDSSDLRGSILLSVLVRSESK